MDASYHYDLNVVVVVAAAAAAAAAAARGSSSSSGSIGRSGAVATICVDQRSDLDGMQRTLSINQ
jgi:hypothetical protein